MADSEEKGEQASDGSKFDIDKDGIQLLATDAGKNLEVLEPICRGQGVRVALAAPAPPKLIRKEEAVKTNASPHNKSSEDDHNP